MLSLTVVSGLRCAPQCIVDSFFQVSVKTRFIASTEVVSFLVSAVNALTLNSLLCIKKPAA